MNSVHPSLVYHWFRFGVNRFFEVFMWTPQVYDASSVLTYSPRLKPGDSGISKDCTSHDGLTSSTPTDNALPAFCILMPTEVLNLHLRCSVPHSCLCRDGVRMMGNPIREPTDSLLLDSGSSIHGTTDLMDRIYLL